ncbi:hypothetical protein [Variovorax sp. 770b2]|nr:hypothetical protein [Variovorax sp. 770b2]
MNPPRRQETSRISRWLRSHSASAAGLGALAAVAVWLVFWFSGD